MSQNVYVIDRKCGLFQAIRDRRSRKCPGSFFTAKAFSRCGCDQVAVDKQRRRRILALTDPVFALFERRPMSFLEGERPIESADSQDLHSTVGRCSATNLVNREWRTRIAGPFSYQPPRCVAEAASSR